ncbi:MAG TPA: hypothetical protein VF779_20580 [Pyrinomonadaceae bacterium]
MKDEGGRMKDKWDEASAFPFILPPSAFILALLPLVASVFLEYQFNHLKLYA